jgi:hypothetical protein
MLCARCGQREAEPVIYVEARLPGRPATSTPEQRRAREEEMSRLCPQCCFEVTIPPEHLDHARQFFDAQERMHAAAAAHPPSDALRPLLDALEVEATRDPPDLALTRQRLEELLRFLASAEGRTLANVDATADRLQWASDWQHLPEPEREILGTLLATTLEALWLPESPHTRHALPEQLLVRLRDET